MLNLDKSEINKRLKLSLEGHTPQLTCIVTGKSRVTNNDFLKGKVEQFGSVDNYHQNYICREALKLLQEGKGYREVRFTLEVPESVPLLSSERLKAALEYYK